MDEVVTGLNGLYEELSIYQILEVGNIFENLNNGNKHLFDSVAFVLAVVLRKIGINPHSAFIFMSDADHLPRDFKGSKLGN